MDTSFFVREHRETYKQQGQKKYIVININKNGINFMNDIKNSLKLYENKNYKYYFIPVSNG